MLDKLYRKFEETFDIPFVSSHGLNGRDIWYKIGPKSSAKEYFTIKISFVNDIRLVMELLPDEYSRPFIEDIGKAPQEKKETFFQYAKMFSDRKAKLSFRLNNQAASLNSCEQWPNLWEHISLRFSRSPISAEQIVHEDVIVDWGIAMMGMILSLANIVPIDPDATDSTLPRIEGNAKQVMSTKYERNPINRALCLATKCHSCHICGMDFKSVYGSLGIDFIHVHHTVPVSKMGPNYKVDPQKELFPVCPNCHAMLHRTDPPMPLDELKQIYLANKKEPVLNH